MITIPTTTEYTNKVYGGSTAYTYDQVVEVIKEALAIEQEYIGVMKQFDAVFTARYKERIPGYANPMIVEHRMDSQYPAMRKVYDATFTLEEFSAGNGAAYNRSGGSSEVYPIVKWQALIKKHQTLIKKMQKYL